jgi:diguanylate cyclase (GGDEF)-like protein/PAS domain S-box-containing protein
MHDPTSLSEPFRAFFEAASDPIVVIDPAQNISQFNKAAEVLFGWPADEIIGEPLTRLIPQEKAEHHTEYVSQFFGSTDSWRKMSEERPQLSGLRKDGRAFPAEVAISKTQVQGQWHAIAIVHDISDQVRTQAALSSLPHRDPLTGLHDRAALTRYLEHLVLDHTVPRLIGLCFIDIDHFARINDVCSYTCGDELLNAFAARLSENARPTDYLARFSGDQFVLITQLSGDPDQALLIEGQRLHTLWSRPFQAGDRQWRITADVGAAAATTTNIGQVQGLLARADIALQAAKQNGTNQFMLYDAKTAAAARDEQDLAHGLETALADREFFLTFQPIVHLAQSRLRGFEALLRWNFQQRLIPPDRFIPLAERQGQINDIGNWTLEQACGQIAQLSSVWGHPLQIAVNLSPRQLVQPDLADRVSAVLSQTGLTPDQLTMEITETALLDEEKAETALWKLKSTGAQLALDDFGTGFSSLTHLRRFPLNMIKIDKSFTAGIDRGDEQDHAIIASMIGLAHSLGLDVVVEGVETIEQARALTELGADKAQGYLYGRPMLPDQALEHCHGRYGSVPRQSKAYHLNTFLN